MTTEKLKEQIEQRRQERVATIDRLIEEAASHLVLDALPLEYKLREARARRQVDPLEFINAR